MLGEHLQRYLGIEYHLIMMTKGLFGGDFRPRKPPPLLPESNFSSTARLRYTPYSVVLKALLLTQNLFRGFEVVPDVPEILTGVLRSYPSDTLPLSISHSAHRYLGGVFECSIFTKFRIGSTQVIHYTQVFLRAPTHYSGRVSWV